MATDYGTQATSGSLDLGASNAAYNQGVSTGQTAINSFDPTGTKTSQQTALGQGGLGGLLGGETTDFTNQYRQAVAANPTVTSLYNTANTLFNVPSLAMNAANLQNRVTNTIPAEFQSAKGFDIGAPQVENAIAARTGYLAPQAQAAENLAQTAQGLAGKYVEAGLAQNQFNLLPIQAQQQFEMQRQAAQATGWNQAAQNEFQGLVAKMNAGVTLSQAEIQRANELASIQEQYQATLASNAAALGGQQLRNQYQVLSPAQTLINTFTGGRYQAPS